MFRLALLLILVTLAPSHADELFGTDPLRETTEFPFKLKAAIEAYLKREIKNPPQIVFKNSSEEWVRLQNLLGMRDWSTVARNEILGDFKTPILLAKTDKYQILAVRWSVFEQVDGEGLIIEPIKGAIANVVLIPDGHQIPEDLVGLTTALPIGLQLGRILAELRFRVVIPAIVSSSLQRRSSFGGVEIPWATDREVVQRMAFSMSRNLIAYEVQKVIVAGDYLRETSDKPLAVIGLGEGAVIALYAGALDRIFSVVAPIGYAGPTAEIASEPISRQIWRIRKEFGAAGIWRRLKQSHLCIGYADQVEPVLRLIGFSQLLPLCGDCVMGSQFLTEWEEQEKSPEQGERLAIKFTDPRASMKKLIKFMKDRMRLKELEPYPDSFAPIQSICKSDFSIGRHHLQATQIVRHLQDSREYMQDLRWKNFYLDRPKDKKNPFSYIEDVRQEFESNLIGKLPDPSGKQEAKSRFLLETNKWRSYEVKLEDNEGLFVTGIFLKPKGLKFGELRPLIICLHDVDSSPDRICGSASEEPSNFASRLADQGYFVFAPLMPHSKLGGGNHDEWNRFAYPLGLTTMSFVARMNGKMLTWLLTIPQVNTKKIGIYGIGNGGSCALRLAALDTRYVFAICNAGIKDRILNVVDDWNKRAKPFEQMCELSEFGAARTFTDVETAYLIAPRALRFEKSLDDRSVSDEFVASEFAKILRFYVKHRHQKDRVELDFYDEQITAARLKSLRFIQKQTGWPIYADDDN